jgi:hypothetical protein
MVALRFGIPALAVAAGVWLLTSSGPLPAQAPPDQPASANQDTDQRLKALEEKMDRVLKILDARGEDAALQAFTQARDKLQVALEAQEKKYADFRRSAPAHVRDVTAIDKRRNDLRMKHAEMEKQLAEIKRVFKEKGREEALYLVFSMGLKLRLFESINDIRAETLKLRLKLDDLRTRLGDNHPDVKYVKNAIALYEQILNQQMDAFPNPKPASGGDAGRVQKVDVLEVHIKAIEAEIQNYRALIQTHDELFFNIEQKVIRDARDFEAKDANFRQEIQHLRDALATLEKLIREGKGPEPSK